MSLVSREVLNRDRPLANFTYLDYTDRDISTQRTERKKHELSSSESKKRRSKAI